MLNDQSINSGVNHQHKNSDDDNIGEYIDLDSPEKIISNSLHENDLQVKSLKSSIDTQNCQPSDEQMDASKISTSPPSNSIRQSIKPVEKIQDIIGKTHQIISSSIHQQQLLMKIREENNFNHNISEMLSQLQQLQIQQQEQLVSLEKLQTLKQQEYNEQRRQINEQNFQRFKIKSELDNDKGHLKNDIDLFFGSTQKFIATLKTDSLQIYNFMKHQSQRITQPLQQTQKFTSQSNETQLKRKASDPLFDNEDYLKQIEEKYMQQFEKQFSMENNKEMNQQFNQQRETSHNNAKNNKEDQSKQKKKRLNSEDKYDKKEYQERMEQQFMKILKSQFPVSDSEEEQETQQSNKTQNQVQLTEEQEFIATLEKLVNQPQKETKKQHLIINHQKQKSSRTLKIDMPEELINLLGDSKDMLEDPNGQNYFEIENSLDQEIALEIVDQEQKLNGITIETPAFGKKKPPILFKGQPGTNSEQQLFGSTSTGKKNKSKQSPDFLAINKSEKNQFAYDNWKQEVKKAFTKKKPERQQISSKSPAIVTMQQNMSPIGKQKSPTNPHSRNILPTKADSMQSLASRDRMNKTQQHFSSQSQMDNGIPQSTKQKNTIASKSQISSKPQTAGQRESSRNKTNGNRTIREETKKAGFNVQQPSGNITVNSTSGMGSMMTSRNLKQSNLNKILSQQTVSSQIDITIQKNEKDQLQLDIKQLEQLNPSLIQQNANLNSARITGGGGRIALTGSILGNKSRNNAPSKSPSLR